MERELPPGRRVAPSILSADYSRLGAEVQEVMDAGARVIHVDEETARPCRESGARLFVAGSAVFGSEDPAVAYQRVVAAAGAE